MKDLCKHCGSGVRVKNGYVQGKQRYKCKECRKTYREGDLRERYRPISNIAAKKSYKELYEQSVVCLEYSRI